MDSIGIVYVRTFGCCLVFHIIFFLFSTFFYLDRIRWIKEQTTMKKKGERETDVAA